MELQPDVWRPIQPSFSFVPQAAEEGDHPGVVAERPLLEEVEVQWTLLVVEVEEWPGVEWDTVEGDETMR